VCNCHLNRRASHVCLYFPPLHPPAQLCPTQPHVMRGRWNYTHGSEHGYSFFSRALVGPPLNTTLIRPSVQPLNQIYEIHTMQEDGTTNLTLATPRSIDSSSHNLQISSKFSRQMTIVMGTNEVPLWAHQPYIVPFSKLPHLVTRAQRLYFLICSQPWDYGLAIYTVTFPGSSSELGPRGAFFSCHVQVRMLMFKIIK
jgi:hypothetical protein